jgi:hypothetical protein
MLCSFACSTKPEGAATSEQRWVHDSVHVVLYLRCLCLFCVMPLVYVQYLQLWEGCSAVNDSGCSSAGISVECLDLTTSWHPPPSASYTCMLAGCRVGKRFACTD